MVIKKVTKTIEKILSINCRDCFLFDGLHQFNFHDGINTIVGANASGKTSLITMILEILCPKTSSDVFERANNVNDSLIEMQFIVDNELHFLRRVISHGVTTDLHLYIGEDKEFLRDWQVVSFLETLKPIIQLNQQITEEFRLWIVNQGKSIEFPMNPSKYLVETVNLILSKLELRYRFTTRNGELQITNKEGSTKFLDGLPSSKLIAMSLLIEMAGKIIQIEKENLSKVIVVDGNYSRLGMKYSQIIVKALEIIADDFGCQVVMTSRASRGRKNVIFLGGPSIPKEYVIDYYGTQISKIGRHFTR